MPIYEYKCLECGTHIEKMQKVSDAPLQTCESCGGRLEKQISLSGFQFKGAGWYVTDYAKKSGVAALTADKSEKSEKSETTEKTSTGESTVKTEGASKQSSETLVKDSKKETAAKKE